MCALTLSLVLGFASVTQQPVARATLVPVLRIGSVDGQHDALSQIGGLVVGPNGRIYISQPRARQIKVFDSAGRFVRTIGRDGEGPGEFRWPNQIGWHADSLAVFDATLRRVSLFDSTGTLLRDQTIITPPLGLHLGSSGPTAILDNGTLLVPALYILEDVAAGLVSSRPFVLVSGSGEIIDTVAVLPVRAVFVIKRGNSSYQGEQPFTRRPLVRMGPLGRHLHIIEFPVESDGKAVVRVTKLTSSADTVYSRSYSFPKIPIPGSIRDSVYDAVANALSRGDSPLFTRAAGEREARDKVEIPAYYPPADAAFADEDGRLWLRVGVPVEAMSLWEILGPTGERMGQVRVPAGADLRYGRGENVWGIEWDELDVPYVVRYRVRR
jgi:hypothetical protein